MQFLLLLSALLSALTGATGAPRHADARAGQTEAQLVAEAPAERRVLAAAAARLVQPQGRRVSDVATIPPVEAAPARSAPLDLVRLNE